MRSPVSCVLALAIAAVAGLGSMRRVDDGSRRAERVTLETALFGAPSFYGSGSSRLLPAAGQPEPETTPPADVEPRAGLVPVTLDVQYENGVRPRSVFLVLPCDGSGKVQAIVARNPDRSGVFRVHLEPGSHRVRWLFDRLTMHQDDPQPLGTPEWTIDTRNSATWDLTVPVAAQVLVHDPDRGLPELWLDGMRVSPKWEEWDSSHRGGPLYLTTASTQASSSKIALVKPGTYTIYRGTGAERWCRTVVLNASEPFVLDRNR